MTSSACNSTMNNFLWDVLDNVEKRRCGLVNPNTFEYRLSRQLAKKYTVSESHYFHHMAEPEDAVVRENRLAIVNQSLLAIFDVSSGAGNAKRLYKQIADIVYPLARQSSRGPRRCPGTLSPSACVRWSSAGAVLTTSGMNMDHNAVRIFDAATLQVVDTLAFNTYHSQAVFTHEHSPIDPAIVAVGTSLSEPILADLRTGNIVTNCGTPLTGSVIGIAWSPSDENLLVTDSGHQLATWDRRYVSKPLTIFFDGRPKDLSMFCGFPHIEFYSHDRIVVMSPRYEACSYNPYTGVLLQKISHEYGGNHKRRLKFGLNRIAQLLYFPFKRHIRGYDLASNEFVAFPKSAHLYRVEMILFNDSTKEIYSLNTNGEAIVWTPF